MARSATSAQRSRATRIAADEPEVIRLSPFRAPWRAAPVVAAAPVLHTIAVSSDDMTALAVGAVSAALVVVAAVVVLRGRPRG